MDAKHAVPQIGFVLRNTLLGNWLFGVSKPCAFGAPRNTSIGLAESIISGFGCSNLLGKRNAHLSSFACLIPCRRIARSPSSRRALVRLFSEAYITVTGAFETCPDGGLAPCFFSARGYHCYARLPSPFLPFLTSRSPFVVHLGAFPRRPRPTSRPTAGVWSIGTNKGPLWGRALPTSRAAIWGKPSS